MLLEKLLFLLYEQFSLTATGSSFKFRYMSEEKE